MEITLMQQTYSDLLSKLFSEGIVNQQFRKLHELQDEHEPRFVLETVSLFSETAVKLINNISSELKQPAVDYNKIKVVVHQLIGGNKTIGAQRIDDAAVDLHNCCIANDLQGCFCSFQQLNQNFLDFKSRLDALFTVEQQIVEAGGSIPKIP